MQTPMKASFQKNTEKVDSLSRHHSRRVLSVDRRMHEWSDEDLQTMALWGNDRANAYFPLSLLLTMEILECKRIPQGETRYAKK